MQQAVGRVRVVPALHRYVVALLTATRTTRDIYLGASPRAGIALVRAAKALARASRARFRGTTRPQGPLRSSPGSPHHPLLRRQGARADRRSGDRQAARGGPRTGSVAITRPTSRGLALLAVAAATYLAARIVGTWELYLVAVAFLATAARVVAPGARRPAASSRRLAPCVPSNPRPATTSWSRSA